MPGFFKKIFKFIRWTIALMFVSSILVVVLYRFLPVYVTPLMLIRCYEQMTSGEELACYHRWVSIDEMSIYMPVAVIASEDQRFMEHHGFDYKAIQQAAKENQQEGRKRIRGGSTISQQTAKNVFLWPGRSWLRKGLEAYFTFLMEMMWSKQRIMEVYLNSIEMGNGIYGVEAVARENFNSTAKDLSREQCALIAATLPNPRRYSSAYPSPYMQKRQRQIQVQMKHIPVMKVR